MPMYHFRCVSCSEPKTRLLKNDTVNPGPCSKCGGEVKREAKGASTRTVEKLDNGAMPRAVERLSDIETMRKEYAASDPQLKRNDRI
jgi:hypothetical protein